MDLHCLYDSDCFIVVHVAPDQPGEGFELVNKQTGTSSYLTGDAAWAFRAQVQAWHVNNPHADECEDTLEAFMQWAPCIPMRTH